MILTRRDKVYTFDKSVELGAIANNATIDQAGAWSFRLSDLPESSSFTTLFDTYRFVQVDISFVPRDITSTLPPLVSVIDYDDANPLSSLSSADDYDTVMTTQTGQLHRRVLKPRAALAAYSGAFSSYAQTKDQWIDAASPSVLYYGVKTYFNANPGPTENVYTVKAHYVIQFKNTR
jgi:hypothetical protein